MAGEAMRQRQSLWQEVLGEVQSGNLKVHAQAVLCIKCICVLFLYASLAE
jgi:hypothetical protein